MIECKTCGAESSDYKCEYCGNLKIDPMKLLNAGVPIHCTINQVRRLFDLQEI